MVDLENLEKLKAVGLTEIARAMDRQNLFAVEKKYLGRKGSLTGFLRALKDLPISARREIGQRANALRSELISALQNRQRFFQTQAKTSQFDVTEPGLFFPTGRLHPLTRVRREIEDFFEGYGFTVLEGPEVESDYYNFEVLNIPPDHPARDIWDTFYIKSKSVRRDGPKAKADERLLLRTHTSPMQVRVMEKNGPPLAVIVPGRTFRHEATDARHEHTFDQVEGFYVGQEVSAANLKYILHGLFKYLFGPKVEIKLRPGYFPFTEPSFELLMSCPFCENKGCTVCGNGWLEMLGAGMIHPKVFQAAGYKSGKWRGFAFGMGIARIAMLKYQIPDIRLFYENDLRVLNQF